MHLTGVKNSPLVSIVVVDYNGHRFWPKLLCSLENQVFRDFELIVVDNSGRLDPELVSGGLCSRIIKSPGNVGFAEGSNLGFKTAKGEYVCLLNNDTELEDQWLGALFDCIVSSRDIGAVCSKVVYKQRFARVEIESDTFRPIGDSRRLGVRIEFDGLGCFPFEGVEKNGLYSTEKDGVHAWAWTNGKATLWLPCEGDRTVQFSLSSATELHGSSVRLLWDCGEQSFVIENEATVVSLEIPDDQQFDIVNNAGSYLDEAWRVKERGLFKKDCPELCQPIELEVASGCSILIRRSALLDVPFDAEFFAYFEDTDLSLNLKRGGWRLLYEPRSLVRHYGAATSGVQSPFQVFHSTRNRFWVIAKHAPWNVVWKTLSRELWELDRYEGWMNEEYSLSRLKWETWSGFLKRIWRRLCDSD
ncbi:glycosyltransferase [Pelagicoccus mobilis]|uniref:glycosyltransferase n=1 Tax=Pelagicoccus mobilis TaxID=415221 RepID=UPI001904205A